MARQRRWITAGCVAYAVALTVGSFAWAADSARAEKKASTPVPDTVPVSQTAEPYTPDTGEVELLARLIWGEARGCSRAEQEAVCWCVLNRVDDTSGYYPDTVTAVVLQPGQFLGYSEGNPLEETLMDVARDVLTDYASGGADRVLPEGYLFFTGDGTTNTFRTTYTGGETWRAEK